MTCVETGRRHWNRRSTDGHLRLWPHSRIHQIYLLFHAEKTSLYVCLWQLNICKITFRDILLIAVIFYTYFGMPFYLPLLILLFRVCLCFNSWFLRLTVTGCKNLFNLESYVEHVSVIQNKIIRVLYELLQSLKTFNVYSTYCADTLYTACCYFLTDDI